LLALEATSGRVVGLPSLVKRNPRASAVAAGGDWYSQQPHRYHSEWPPDHRRYFRSERTEVLDMGIISYLISLAIVGLVIGALGRLVVPGPNPIAIGTTILIGIVGAVFGAVIGGLLGLGFLSILFEVGISASLVYVLSSHLNKRQLPPTTWR
jgi:uncharacterized membrane protein YeaQ/YmgE (transglycosylase-associated protein family)